MYRLSVISDEVSNDLSESIKFALYNDLNFIDLRSVGGDNLINLKMNKIIDFYNQIVNVGLKCFCYPSPLLKWNQNFDNEKLLIDKGFEIAERLECKYIRIFSYLKQKAFSLEKFAEKLSILNDLARKSDKYLLLENEPVCNIQTFKDLAFFFNKYSFSRIFPLPDLGNDTEINSMSGLQDLAQILPMSPCIHIKDYSWNELSYVIVGNGDSCIEKCLNLLENQNINPVLTLETHISLDRKNASQRSIEAIKRMVRF